MKKYLLIILISFVCKANSQTTIILIRHAEKDTTAQGSSMMSANPPLSKAGEQRALQLLNELKNYKPDIIYSTDFIRTKSTIIPIAQKFNKEILVYNSKELNKLADELLAVNNNKTIIVVGHSNTTPALVNLLIKQNKYQSLPDNVYNQYWIVTINNGVAEDKLITY